MLRIVKIMLVAAVAVWGLLGAFENVMDWGGTVGAVGAAASMSTFEGGTESWKATSNPVIIYAGVLFIIFFKLAVAALCGLGAFKMFAAHGGDAASFASAKALGVAGCGVGMFLLFTGWIVIGEGWYEMWRSDLFRDLAAESAFRYGAMILLIGLFVGATDD